MNEVLVRAVVEAAAFFALAADSAIDPDTATQQLEQLHAILQRLDAPSRRQMMTIVSSFRSEDPRRQEFYEQFIEELAAHP